MQRPRDNLTKPGGRPLQSYGPAPLPAPQQPDAGAYPQGIGFDRTSVHLFGAPRVEGLIGVYGPVDVLTTPDAVERVEVRRLAVYGAPEGFWLARCWWSIGAAGGAAQELQGEAELNDTAGGATVDPALRSGISWTRYGSLDDPEPVAIQLAQGQRFQLTIRSGVTTTIGLSVYVRAAGMIYYRRGGSL